MLWKMALKEIRHNRLFSFLFLFNVAIGLLGLVTIENFKVSFEQVLGQRAKNLLGADIALSSRFPLTKEKREKFHALVKKEGGEYSETNLLTMFSMGKGRKSSRLIYLHTLTRPSEGEGLYPYYGWIELDGKEKFPEIKKTLPGRFELWAYPEVVQQLGSREIRIGNKDFKIVSIVTDDSQQTFEMGSVAPKLFINLQDAKDAGLIQKGSTLRYYTLVKTAQTINEELVTELNESFDDNALNVRTPEKSSQQVGRILAYLSDFLGLVSLVALFLASVGLFYLYRSHLGAKRLSFGLYSALGLKQNQIFGLYFRQVFLLGLVGSLLGLALSALIIPSINFLLTFVLPFELPALVSPRALIIGLSVGILGVMLLSYPLILGAVRQKPASLFQEVAELGQGKFSTSWLHFLPYIMFFALMSFYASQSFKVGGLFLIIFSLATILSFPVGMGLLRLGKTVSQTAGLRLKLSLRYLNRYWVSTISIFLSLLLGCMLLNLIPMLEQSISQELKIGKESSLPSLFLFDIQDEQVQDLQSYFERDQKLDLLSLSPFIRSRIIKINGEPVKVDNKKALTREEQREQRFRNRGTNLSYRDTLSDSEELIEGTAFPGPFPEGS
ncbi:MAG: FtsX-like permease family protein, partial [Halobacteriovoraceae bacterium]|nr:FtsX-like permease family protein [Halobacteriovoraceae bacterium]